MPNEFKSEIAGPLAVVALLLLQSCAVNLPPGPATSAADPHAPEAAGAPRRSSLLATSRNFLSPAADDREEKAKKMDHSKMKMDGMSGMSGMQGMSGNAAAAAPYYTCLMHPEIHEAKPGQCPKCGMTLVKKSGAAEGAKP